MPSWSSAEFRASDNAYCPETEAERPNIKAVRELFVVDQALEAYEPLETLGKGGMGVVVKALESSTGRLVALKVVPRVENRVELIAEGKESPQRFEVEVRATARLQHPNIVPIFAVGHGNGFSFYTMRLINGVSITRLLVELASRKSSSPSSTLTLDDINQTVESICQGTVLPSSVGEHANSTANDSDAAVSKSTDRAQGNEDEVPTRVDEPADTPVSLDSGHEPQVFESERLSQRPFEMPVYQSFAARIAEIADALQYASDEGVVHRDVKPSNILVDGAGKLYLADFGLAKIQDPDSDQSTACVGTPGYIPPERLQGQAATDPRSDIFALGLVLEQLATLSTTSPLRAKDPSNSKRASALASVPRPLRRIIGAATAEELSDRYECAGEFAEDLRRFVRGEPVLAGAKDRKTALIAQLRRPVLRRMVVGAFLAVAVLSLGYVALDRMRISEDRKQVQDTNDKTVALYLDMVDDLYLKASNDFARSSLDRSRQSLAAEVAPMSPDQRDKLLLGFGYLDELAKTQSNNTSTILRIAQTMGRVGFVLQMGGCDDDAGRAYDKADELLVGLNEAGLRAAIERCWIAYHQSSWLHRKFGYERAADGYQRVNELAAPFLGKDSMKEQSGKRLHEVVGMTRLAQEDFRGAVKHLEAANVGASSGESRLLALATAYRMIGRYEEALPIATACAVENPKSAVGWRNLAAIQMHLGDVDQAADNYEKCLSIDDSSEFALQGLAWAKHRQGDTERAIELVNQAIEISSANEVILAARAVFLADQDRFEESTEDLVKAYRLRPGSGYVADKLFPALLFFPNPNVDLADRLLLENGDKLPPPSYQFARALVDYALGRYGRAASGFRSMQQFSGGRHPDLRGLTLAWLSDVRCVETNPEQWGEAMMELEHQRYNDWPHFGLSPFDRAIVWHLNSFLNEPFSR